jgi:hypothetical protein
MFQFDRATVSFCGTNSVLVRLLRVFPVDRYFHARRGLKLRTLGVLLGRPLRRAAGIQLDLFASDAFSRADAHRNARFAVNLYHDRGSAPRINNVGEVLDAGHAGTFRRSAQRQ